MHAQVRLGDDPAGQKVEGRVRAGETLGAVIRAYLTYQSGHLRRRSYTETRTPLVEVLQTAAWLAACEDRSPCGCARIADVASSSGAATGNRVRASLSALFSWAMRQGLCDVNPVAGAIARPRQSRARVLSDGELKVIWGALGADDYSAIIKLLILVWVPTRGNRLAVLGAEVTDDQIVLPPQRTKNSRASRSGHTSGARHSRQPRSVTACSCLAGTAQSVFRLGYQQE